MATLTKTQTPTAPAAQQAIKAKRSWTDYAFYVGIALIVIYCLAPFYWMLVSALKPSTAIFNNNLLPTDVSMENFRAVFSGRNDFGRSLLNGFIIAGAATIVAMVIGVFAAYALARLEFRGKFLVLGAILATAMFPGVAIVTPLFKLFSDIGWVGDYHSMIIPDVSFTLPLAIWILTSFFAEMPWELEQAAKIDGCTPGQAFRLVILPLAAPGVFTTMILVFINAWNEYLIASVMSTPETQPPTVAIAKFVGESQFQQPFGTQMAAGVVVTIPLVILVLAFQKRIVAGLTAGGVKG